MTGYRTRIAKPTAALWLLVVLGDAGSAMTSGNRAVLGGVVAIATVALVVLGTYVALVIFHTSRATSQPARAARHGRYSYK
jgi:hypothetical protein